MHGVLKTPAHRVLPEISPPVLVLAGSDVSFVAHHDENSMPALAPPHKTPTMLLPSVVAVPAGIAC